MTTLYLILASLAVLALGALAYVKLFRHKIPVAGGRGPARFSRAAYEAKDAKKTRFRQTSSFNYRTLALWMAVFIIVVWVGFSLASRSNEETEETPTLETKLDDKLDPPPPDKPPVPRLTPILSGSLSGPPPEGPIPPGPAVAPKPAPQPVPAPTPKPTAGPNPAPATSPGSTPPLFEPRPDPNRPSPMVTAAQSMAPVISRMEPVGRGLSAPTSKPLPTPQGSLKSKKLPPPPVRPAPQPSPPNLEPEATLVPPTPTKWTVLLGAFGKQQNALALKTRMEVAGLPVSISEVTEKNKLWHRVMSGAFDDKASAEAYCRELRQRKLVERPYVKPL